MCPSRNFQMLRGAIVNAIMNTKLRGVEGSSLGLSYILDRYINVHAEKYCHFATKVRR